MKTNHPKPVNVFIEILAWIPYIGMFLLNKDFRESLRRMSWSRAQMQAYQLERLQDIVAHAYEHSPFYKKFYDDAGVTPSDLKTLQDAEKFPILTKEIMRRAVADKTIFTTAETPRGVMETSTTGSSGDPLTLHLDMSARRAKYISHTRSLFMMGTFPASKVALVWRKKSMTWRQKLTYWMGVFREVSVIDVMNAKQGGVGADELKQVVDDLVAYDPEVIKGYVSALWVIAQYVKKHNIPLRPKRIILVAEYVPNVWWREMEEIFKCPVHNFYGGTEAAPIALSCADETDLVVFSDFYHTELVDSSGRGIVSNDPGRIIVTDYNSRYMPIIRYEVGDIATWSTRQQGAFPRFAEVTGRINDIFVLPGGKMLFSHNWHIHFRDIQSISKFKVVQKTVNHIDIAMETITPGMDWNDELRALKSEVETGLGPHVTVAWSLVDHLPVDRGEKFRSVKSEVDIATIINNL